MTHSDEIHLPPIVRVAAVIVTLVLVALGAAVYPAHSTSDEREAAATDDGELTLPCRAGNLGEHYECWKWLD